MKKYEDFLDEVMPWVPGCTVEMAIMAIRNTCIDFCEQTLILQRDLDPVTVAANIADYDLEPEAGQRVIRIMRAWYNTAELTPLPPDMNDSVAAYRADLSVGATPQHYFQKDDTSFSLLPPPSGRERNAVTLRVALAPTRDSDKVDDMLLNRFGEAIGFGAKARLMSMPYKPFSNPNEAKTQGGMYGIRLNAARIEAVTGNMRTGNRVKMRRFF